MKSEPPGPRQLTVPILALRNSVLFPMSVVPINVGRPRSVRLVESMVDRTNALVGVVTQRVSETIEPTFEDLYPVGTLARIVKVIRLGAGNYSVVLNGVGRFRIEEPQAIEPFMKAVITRLSDEERGHPGLQVSGERLRQLSREVLSLLPDVPRDALSILDNVNDAGALADLVASGSPEDVATVAVRQAVLEATSVFERVELVLELLEHQLEVLQVRRHIAVDELSSSQREQVLRQQMRHIKEELGESDEDDEIEGLRERIAAVGMPEEADRAARKQLRRLAGIPSASAEYQVARNYLDWLVELPWSRTTTDRNDVAEVRRCLEEDHYGLGSVKRRIVEFSAVRQLRADKRGPILLFVGPPGVGKTSLGRSIARAMGRKYGRIALGGVRDEAEIRGHRRTYVGALPGRIIQALKKAGTRNPVLVLDEVDKMGADVRGDPAAALLEALDPEQNGSFVDHYIDLPFDLSQVLFLATANYYGQIPESLRDRLETIDVPGYTRHEKLGIATQFLVPKQLREHGLSDERLRFESTGLEEIIDSYTREPGVRGLEREIARVCRAVTVKLAEGNVGPSLVDRSSAAELLGTAKFSPELSDKLTHPGVATGVGISGAGGELLIVETTLMDGSGSIRLTGSLGPVLRESAEAAVSYLRSRAERFGLAPNWLEKKELHVHVPRARAAVDSAGVGLAICAAVFSLLSQRRVRERTCLAGELTLRGALLPVKNLKDILLAVHRANITRLCLPWQNQRDLVDIPEEVLNAVELLFVHDVTEALSQTLCPEAETSAERAIEMNAEWAM